MLGSVSQRRLKFVTGLSGEESGAQPGGVFGKFLEASIEFWMPRDNSLTFERGASDNSIDRASARLAHQESSFEERDR